MPTFCALHGSARYLPHKGDRIAVAVGEREIAGPYLAAKGLARATWTPPILHLQCTARWHVDTHIISINGGTIVVARWSYPCIAQGRMMNGIALYVDGHLIIHGIGNPPVRLIWGEI